MSYLLGSESVRLYSLFVDDDLSDFVYIINDVVYEAETLDQSGESSIVGMFMPTESNEIIDRYEEVPPLNIDPNGSQLLIIQMRDEAIDLIYQQQSDCRFIQLTDWAELDFPYNINDVKILDVPLPNGRDIDGTFEKLPLRELDTSIVDELLRKRNRRETISLNQILEFLNPQTEPLIRQLESSFSKSYETLLRRLYKL